MNTITIADMRKATIDARSRANDPAIGVRAEAGQFQVVSVTFVKRASTVAELSGWGSVGDAVRFLNAMGQQ